MHNLPGNPGYHKHLARLNEQSLLDRIMTKRQQYRTRQALEAAVFAAAVIAVFYLAWIGPQVAAVYPVGG